MAVAPEAKQIQLGMKTHALCSSTSAEPWKAKDSALERTWNEIEFKILQRVLIPIVHFRDTREEGRGVIYLLYLEGTKIKFCGQTILRIEQSN